MATGRSKRAKPVAGTAPQSVVHDPCGERCRNWSIRLRDDLVGAGPSALARCRELVADLVSLAKLSKSGDTTWRRWSDSKSEFQSIACPARNGIGQLVDSGVL